MSVLVDTSVWVEHFRGRLCALVPLLETGTVLTHPVVIGELATGNLRDRRRTLRDLESLPRASVPSLQECLVLIEAEHLYGTGIGWCDVQLLASARLDGLQIWTVDRVLDRVARRLGVAFAP